VKGLRRILQISGGVSARIFRMFNEVAIEAIETGAERITDEAPLLSDGHRREELFCLTIGT